MIYNFCDLNEDEKRELYDYITTFGSNYFFEDYEGMVKEYTSPAFNYGKNYMVLYEDGVKGTLAVITKDVKERGEVFITCINILQKYKDDFVKLIEEGLKRAIKVQPNSIKLGIHTGKEYLIPLVKKLKFQEAYKAVVLKLHHEKELSKISDLKKIKFKNFTKENKGDFQKVHNEGFSNSPNGAILIDKEIDEMLEDHKNKPHLVGVLYFEDKAAGIYELSIKDKTGQIEAIAVSPEFQGKGLARYLLKKSIEILKEEGAAEIKLFVISSNKIAYDLYKKVGFNEEKVTSNWFDKKVNNG